VVDHRRNHALEAQEDSELNSDKNNREDDPDDCGHQSNSVMKQIAACKRKDEAHRAMRRAGNLVSAQNGMAVDQSPTSMQRQAAAVDDVKFSDRAMSGF
jgi:hypothetical protein